MTHARAFWRGFWCGVAMMLTIMFVLFGRIIIDRLVP